MSITKKILLSMLIGALPMATFAVEPLKVTVEGLEAGGKLPMWSAYCVPPTVADADHNISPAVTWSAGPAGTKSYVLIMTDLDVPKDLSLINKPGVTITAETPRVPFIHWVLVDIPTTVTHLDKGVEGNAFIAKGKPAGPTDHGIRGLNVYTFFYPKDSPNAGPHGAYDGPCPPKNDVVSHRYITEVFAVDIPSVGLSGDFFGEAALEKIKGHILTQGRADANYGGVPPSTGGDKN